MKTLLKSLSDLTSKIEHGGVLTLEYTRDCDSPLRATIKWYLTTIFNYQKIFSKEEIELSSRNIMEVFIIDANRYLNIHYPNLENITHEYNPNLINRGDTRNPKHMLIKGINSACEIKNCIDRMCLKCKLN